MSFSQRVLVLRRMIHILKHHPKQVVGLNNIQKQQWAQEISNTMIDFGVAPLPSFTIAVPLSATKEDVPAKEKEKEALPVEIVKESLDEKCAICLEKFKKDDVVKRLPCLHVFHQFELDTWLAIKPNCPVCRTFL
jgi:hypothetical protein